VSTWNHRLPRLPLTGVFFPSILAEQALRQEEQKPNFSLQLLQITASASHPYNIRLASALCFKNFIKREWINEDGNYKLPEAEVTTIKRELITLMLSVPSGIQSQLGEAVSVIADSDFWERWDTLVDVSEYQYLRRLFHPLHWGGLN
jgi:exportin-2 (importin alpha re-exporter)